jgi:hypothetical protein
MYAVRLEKSTNFAMMTCRSQRALKKALQHRGEHGVRLFIDALARGIVDPPDTIEAIKFRMEQLDLKPADLEDILGGRNRVSEVLNKKRKLTVEMMPSLRKRLAIPAESLLA